MALSNTQLPQMSQLSHDGGLCSATLIGPRVIVTAAHCVTGPRGVFGPILGSYFEVSLIVNPAYKSLTSNDRELLSRQERLWGWSKNDVTLGILEKEITEISPVSLASRMPNDGELILFAGVGLPTAGLRQFGFTEVLKVQPGSVIASNMRRNTQQIVDSGDSGGPNFIVNDRNELSLFGVSSATDHYLEQQSIAAVVDTGRNLHALWLKKIINENNLKVCGVNLNCPSLHLLSHGLRWTMTLELNGAHPLNFPETFPIKGSGFLTESIEGNLALAGLGRTEDFAKIKVKNKIVLVQRGEITFAEKLANAIKAGAKGIIFFNHESENPTSGVDIGQPSSFPMALIGKREGDTLVKKLNSGVSISAKFSAESKEYRF